MSFFRFRCGASSAGRSLIRYASCPPSAAFIAIHTDQDGAIIPEHHDEVWSLGQSYGSD